MFESTIFVVVAILFIATLIRSTFGFGDALVAMPLIAIAAGIQTATAVVAFMSLTISLVIIWESRAEIDFSAIRRLVIAGAVGIPVGIWLLTIAPENLIVGGLGVLLCLFGLYSLLSPELPDLPSDGWGYFFGFLAGCLGGAYNIHGPPVVVYGSLRRWEPTRFRATLQGFFLPSGLFIWLSHGAGGLWNAQVWTIYAWAVVPMLLAIFLGSVVSRRLSPERFHRFMHMLIILLGAFLVLNSI